MRRVFTVFFTFVLRIFYRRIEIDGQERVPLHGPAVFVLNHPNALIDPGLILCLAPRPVSFLAKSTLFNTPGVSWLVKGFDSLPVYRQDDNADPAQNQRTFDMARDLLARGGSIALFPEGTSHSDPALRRFKSGASRLALGAAANAAPGTPPLKIVPAGIFYTDKRTFRSELLICYGEPFDVTPQPLDERFEPPRDAVHALTEQLRLRLDDLVLQAEHREALALAATAERIFKAANPTPDPDDDSLTWTVTLRRRILDTWHRLREAHPQRLDHITQRVNAYEARVNALGLDVEHIAPQSFTLGAVLTYTLRALAFFLLLGPFALVGTLIHLPAWHLIRYLSVKLAKGEEDMISTIKLLASLLFFPASWLLATLPFLAVAPASYVLAALALAPLSGYLALLWHERFERTRDAARGLWVFLRRRAEYRALHDERDAIRRELLALWDEIQAEPGDADADPRGG